MSAASSPKTDLLGHYFLQLPRELRNLIYFHLADSSPIELTDSDLPIRTLHPAVAAEVVEATYTYSTFEIAICKSERYLGSDVPSLNVWERHSEHKKHIRHLVVNTTESVLPVEDGIDALRNMEYYCTVKAPMVRKPWEQLLELPRLESLVINMQKRSISYFNWINFSPVLYSLRERLPQLRITFNMSFDDMLEERWYDPIWRDGRNPYDPDIGEQSITYVPMGFIDVSHMFVPPTEADKKYVDEFLSATTRPTRSNNPLHGLLDEYTANRRLLGQHYVVKDPPLLRVLMAEHYEIYKKARMEITV